MTVQACYKCLHGSYEDVKSRLMTDRLIEKYMLKFLKDTSMDQLEDALDVQDYELAFRSAHTLKGVAANLGFQALYQSASALTEQLRMEKSAPDQALVQGIRSDYSCVTQTLRAYEQDRG